MTGDPKPTITPEEIQRRRMHVRIAIAETREQGADALRIELWGYLHSVLPHPWAAQGDPAICPGDPRNRAHISANCGVAGCSDCHSDRSRRGLARAVGV